MTECKVQLNCDYYFLSLQNSFFSLYLLNGFSKIVDTAVSFAEVAGFTHRYT